MSEPTQETKNFIIQSTIYERGQTTVAIDQEFFKAPDSMWESSGGYWILAIDRTTLEAPYNIFQTSNTDVPAGIDAYLNDKYVIVINTYYLNTLEPPQGDFYQFIDNFGGGRQLRRIQQISTQLSCGSIGRLSYNMTNLLYNPENPEVQKDTLGFEASDYTGAGSGAIQTLQMSRFQLEDDSWTMWTPIDPAD